MSGHSKWSKIKRKKGLNDIKRGAIFTKLAKNIALVVQNAGPDPAMNFGLRLAIEKAKQANMPLKNIEAAIAKASGAGNSNAVTNIIYEGIGPGGVAFLVRCNSDNTNRTVAELRNIFESYHGSLASSGSIMWQFEERGVIEVQPKKISRSVKFGKKDEHIALNLDELSLELIDLPGIIDLKTEGEDSLEGPSIELIIEKNNFAEVYLKLMDKGLVVFESGLQFIPKNPIEITRALRDKLIEFMDKLDEQSDVDEVFINAILV